MHDVRPVGGEVTLHDVSEQFGVAVAAETLCEPSGLGAEEVKGSLYLILCQRLQWEHPVETSAPLSTNTSA